MSEWVKGMLFVHTIHADVGSNMVHPQKYPYSRVGVSLFLFVVVVVVVMKLPILPISFKIAPVKTARFIWNLFYSHSSIDFVLTHSILVIGLVA